MFTSLDLLVVVSMGIIAATFLSLMLMFLLKNQKAKRVFFYIVVALGVYVSTIGFRIGITGFIEQLVYEFEEVLEESFTLKVDISACAAFAGSFDVQEMRRIFDNLISNVQKYAAHEKPVELTVENGERGLTVRQRNAVKKNAQQAQSYKMGLYSILRIAQNYGGGAEVRQSEDEFEIIITLSNL